jgi:hypothetical protein
MSTQKKRKQSLSHSRHKKRRARAVPVARTFNAMEAAFGKMPGSRLKATSNKLQQQCKKCTDTRLPFRVTYDAECP